MGEDVGERELRSSPPLLHAVKASNSFNLQRGGERKKNWISTRLQQSALLCALLFPPLQPDHLYLFFSPQPPLSFPAPSPSSLSLHGRFGLFIQMSGSLRQPFVASHRKTEREGRERERARKGEEGVGGEKEIGKNTKKDKPQLCRGKEKREVNKRDESEGKKKILEEQQSQREVQRSWHTYDSLFHSLRPSPSLNIFSFPLFFPPPLPPCLSVLLFVIWPSRSFKSASPFLSPPPLLLLLLLLSQSHSLLLTNSPSRSQSANLIPLAARSLT